MAVDGGVGEHLAQGVELHNVVVAYGSETLLTVPAVDVGSGKILSRTSGGTVDDDGVSHCEILLSCLRIVGEVNPKAAASSADS